MSRRLTYWAVVLVWMAVIFILSTSLGSPEHTGRFIEPIVRWFKHDISRAAMQNIHLTIRKMAHVINYAVLAVLLWSAMAHWSGERKPAWRWKLALLAFVLAMAHGVVDECHQLLVPGRVGCALDVLIDSGGALLGLLTLWLLRRSPPRTENLDVPVGISTE